MDKEKVDNMLKTIKVRRNDEQYIGGPFPIYHIEFDLIMEYINELEKRITDLNETLNKYDIYD